MRQIGSIPDSKQANLFQNYLRGCGIDAQIDAENDAGKVWIKDEDRLDEAREALAQFQRNPQGTEFKAIAEQAAAARSPRRAHSQPIDVRRQIWGRSSARRTPVMSVLVALCVIVGLSTRLGQDQLGLAFRSLSFFDPRHLADPGFDETRQAWIDITHGQLWRIVTPIFIHFGLIHLAFNLSVLFSLGNVIESRQGSLRMGLLTLVTAITGNVGHYLLSTGGGNLGGISGVVYGLFGFLWIRGIREPQEGVRLANESIVFFLAFLMLGFTGVLDSALDHSRVANWTHLFGMIGGMGMATLLPPLKSRFATRM